MSEKSTGRDISDADLSGARFTRVDLRGARLHDVDLSEAKITDALLDGASISGEMGSLTINGVEVGPYVMSELERRYPERRLLAASDPAGLRAAWQAIVDLWAPTLALAATLSEEQRRTRVDGEWSLVETLRHLLFATDAWFGNAVLGRARGFHPWGLVHTAHRDGGAPLGLDLTAAPSFDDVLGVRRDRQRELAEFLAAVDVATLAEPRRGNDLDSYPPPSTHTVLDCLHVVLGEEWWHHSYAARDLAILTAG